MEVGIVRRVDIEQKMRSAYLDFAMSVITARALPDVRDGLKPVQRRILYAMHDMGMRHDQPTRKSARIVGEVLGKYHPHSDSPVYEALVRMAQDFSMRYVLVEGQGNFGSVDGDEAAAMRYTEARLSAVGEELLVDLDKETVDFGPNFDGSLQEPRVLPAKLPNLLVNGTVGIAVGMATNIPPHNLGEIADATAYLIDHYDGADEVTLDELMQFVHGPDFPTAGTILGREEIRQAYATGKGHIVVRAQAHIEDLRGGHAAIIITELPYQVNKASLVERIAELVRNGRIEGIGDLRDESDRAGMRVVVELKRGVEAGPVLSQLLKQTQMQTTFGVNMLALVEGVPRVLPLKRILLHYIEHRHDVLVRRARYELEKAQARAHILEGLLLALDNLDAVIDTIRRSRTAETAQQNLCAKFKLSEIQARAILDMQLRRLAALERHKIEEEYQEVRKRIATLRGLLASKKKILALIREDVLDLKTRYGDARRTRITDAIVEPTEIGMQAMVPDEEALVLLTHDGVLHRVARGNAANITGVLGQEREGLLAALRANTREALLLFTDKGRAFKVLVHQVPDVLQQPRGLVLSSVVSLGTDEHAVAVVGVPDGETEGLLCLGTRTGKVKRLALGELASPSNAGAQAIGLAEDDALGWVVRTGGEDELVLTTEQGRAIRFAENTVRPQGRSASGVMGISLGEGDRVVGMDVVRSGAELLIVTARGFAKRTSLGEYSTQGRGGMGVATVDVTKMDAAGPLVGAQVVLSGERVVFSTAKGALSDLSVRDVPALERASWGRLVNRSNPGVVIRLANDTLASVTRLDGWAEAEKTPPARAQTATRRQRPTSAKDEEAEPAAQIEMPQPDIPRSKARRASAEAAPSPEEKPPKATQGRTGAQPKTPAKRSESATAATPAGEPAKPPSPPRQRASKTEEEPQQKGPSKAPATEQGSRTRRRAVIKPPQRGRPAKG